MNKQDLYQDLLKRTGVNDNDVLFAYMYGSRVYGNARKNSDYDFIVIVNDSKKDLPQFSDNLINVNFYTYSEHLNRVIEHEPSALECIFLDADYILKETEYKSINFDKIFDVSKLRHAFSAKSSNSWVKAKKKLTVEKDYNDNVGKKSLWHAMRLIDFGIQIAQFGRITNYNSFNHCYDTIMFCKDWSELFETYKQQYNGMLTEFRKLAPK